MQHPWVLLVILENKTEFSFRGISRGMQLVWSTLGDVPERVMHWRNLTLWHTTPLWHVSPLPLRREAALSLAGTFQSEGCMRDVHPFVLHSEMLLLRYHACGMKWSTKCSMHALQVALEDYCTYATEKVIHPRCDALVSCTR